MWSLQFGQLAVGQRFQIWTEVAIKVQPTPSGHNAIIPARIGMGKFIHVFPFIPVKSPHLPPGYVTQTRLVPVRVPRITNPGQWPRAAPDQVAWKVRCPPVQGWQRPEARLAAFLEEGGNVPWIPVKAVHVPEQCAGSRSPSRSTSRRLAPQTDLPEETAGGCLTWLLLLGLALAVYLDDMLLLWEKIMQTLFSPW